LIGKDDLNADDEAIVSPVDYARFGVEAKRSLLGVHIQNVIEPSSSSPNRD
jgi:hypothetical protein